MTPVVGGAFEAGEHTGEQREIRDAAAASLQALLSRVSDANIGISNDRYIHCLKPVYPLSGPTTHVHVCLYPLI